MKTFNLLILITILFLSINAFAITDTNLRAYYNFDETTGTVLTDIVGGNNNGTSSNVTLGQTGIINYDYNFILTSSSKVDLDSNTGMSENIISVNLWIKPNATNLGYIYAFSNGFSTANLFYLYTTNGANIYCGTNTIDVDTTLASNSNTWHMITCTYDGINVRTYLDGVYKNKTATTLTVQRAKIAFGYRPDTSVNYYDGSIDEISIWDANLSTSDITDLWNSGLGLTYPFGGAGTASFTNTINKLTATLNLTDTTTWSGAYTTDRNWIINGTKNATKTIILNYPITAFTDYNTCLEVDSNALTHAFTCLTINSGKFYGDGNFWVFDENTGLPLTGVSIDYNRTPQILSGSSFDFNFQGITTDTYLFQINKIGYASRYYEIDLNQFSDFNIHFGLLPTTTINYKLANFKFFLIDRSTLIDNTYITVTSTKTGNMVVDRLKTESDGTTAYALDMNNSTYRFNFNYAGTDYNYGSISLQILQPKNESDGNLISGNWTYQITGLASISDLNVSETTKTLAIYANTSDSYDVIIGTNTAGYNQRTYMIRERGNTNRQLQPYLALSSIADTISIILKDYQNDTIADAQIDLYKTIGTDGRVLVASIITGYDGLRSVSLITEPPNNTYEVEITIDGILYRWNTGLYYAIKDFVANPTTIMIDPNANDYIPSLIRVINITPDKFYSDLNGTLHWDSETNGYTKVFTKYYRTNTGTSWTTISSVTTTAYYGDYNFAMLTQGLYRIQLTINGSTYKTWDYNYTTTENGIGGWNEINGNMENTFNQEILFIAMFLILIMLSIGLGGITDKGMEIFFILTIALPLIIQIFTLNTILMALTGVVWLSARLLNTYLEGGK